MNYRIDFEPRDLLYFGDGRQPGGSTPGKGANWPLPSVMNSALINTMHRSLAKEVEEIESTHIHLNRHEERNREKGRKVRFSFGGVRSVGPFPVKNGELFFSVPADLQIDANGKKYGYMLIIDNDGENNLPKPLTKLVASSLPPSKETPGNWISLTELQKYLNGDVSIMTTENSEFYLTEQRVGIGINSTTQSVDDEKIYSAEYMRLNPDVALRIYASYMASGYQGQNKVDMMAVALKKGVFDCMILGGQMGVVRQKEMKQENLALPSVKPTKYLKWVLLTPASFLAGWLPGFVDASTGNVRLRQEVERGSKPRDKWREELRTAPEIQAKLVAARIPKYSVVSGWKINDDVSGSPKAAKRLVPAGTVFYFECCDEKNAEMLAKALHGRTHSDEFGEQGFGFGVCGNWYNQI
ncbi:MAG: hypothetical protein IJS08_05410 [Victivallales bacterium]|nr:hypothetical protein [Victivallales bacterium]